MSENKILPCLSPLLLCCFFFASLAQAASVPIDTQGSTLTIHVFKSGLFSGFAHDHEIAAPLSSGSVDAAALAVECRFDARRLAVLDREASAGERAKIEETMRSAKVLDVERFPEIAFISRKVQPTGGNKYDVTGDLTLHGVTHTLTFSVVLATHHYKGTVRLKQSDFGITPISLAGGSVKVKDTVEIGFDVVPSTLTPQRSE